MVQRDLGEIASEPHTYRRGTGDVKEGSTKEHRPNSVDWDQVLGNPPISKYCFVFCFFFFGFGFFAKSHPDRCEAIAHRGFDLCFPDS